MDIFTLAFVALLLTGTLLGGMLFFSVILAPLMARRLPADIASRFGRRAFRLYHLSGAVLAFLAAALSFWSIAGFVLGVAGAGFLFMLVWLTPSINRHRDRGLDGDTAAMGVARNLTHTAHALNATLIAMVLAAFVLLARFGL